MICFPPSSPPADSPPPDIDNDDDHDGDNDDDNYDDNDDDNDDDSPPPNQRELKRMYASTQMICTCRDTNFPPSSTPTWKS